MIKDKTIYFKVLYILQKYPQTRNDNMELITIYWYVYNQDKFSQIEGRDGKKRYLIDTKALRTMEDPESINRIRRVIQNDLGLLQPNSFVIKGRRKKEWDATQHFRKDFTPTQLNHILSYYLKLPIKDRAKVKDNLDNILLINN